MESFKDVVGQVDSRAFTENENGGDDGETTTGVCVFIPYTRATRRSHTSVRKWILKYATDYRSHIPLASLNPVTHSLLPSLIHSTLSLSLSGRIRARSPAHSCHTRTMAGKQWSRAERDDATLKWRRVSSRQCATRIRL